MVRYDSIDLLSFIVYGEVRQYRLTFVHRDDDDDDDEDDDEDDDDDDDDDEVSTKKFFKFLHIRPHKHAWCQLLAVGTTPCGKGFYN